MNINVRKDPMTYEEISAIMGVSRERVKAIEISAMKKIRKYCVKQKIKEDDLSLEKERINDNDYQQEY